jgi:hypothetical protein
MYDQEDDFENLMRSGNGLGIAGNEMLAKRAKKAKKSKPKPKADPKVVNFHGALIIPGPNPKCKHCKRSLNQEVAELVAAQEGLNNLVRRPVSAKDKNMVKAFQEEAEKLDHPCNVEL